MAEVFHKLVKIDRFVAAADMENIIKLIFDSFQSAYTETEQESSSEGIDFKQDYSVIWDTLKAHRGIDLNIDNISWLDFLNLLHGVLLEGKGSLSKVLEFRNYKTPPKVKSAGKVMEREQESSMQKMKRMYQIRKSKDQRIEELNIGFGKMFSYLEGLAKKR